MSTAEDRDRCCLYNVGGCLFSIPFSRLSLFEESLLFKHAISHDHNIRFFIDRDGCTFRHVHYYMHTGELSFSCTSEVNILYEQACGLQITALQQALENYQSTKHLPRARPVNVQFPERAKGCKTEQPEAGEHDSVPLGLIGTPLMDRNEEVHYCFIPLDVIRQHPRLLTEDNLLWICEDVVVLECCSRLFRFLANFLHSGKIVLPEQFTDYEILLSEVDMLGITEFTEAVERHRGNNDVDVPVPRRKVSKSESSCTTLLLYVMTFDLLVKYPDSSLGELYVENNLDDSKMYITGTGVIFQHVENWLGTSRLPLTESMTQLCGVCEYLDRQDGVYLAIKEAFRKFFFRRSTTERPYTAVPWSASVETFTVYRVVKVFVGTCWYATYLRTLLKYSELLSNFQKVRWITFGQTLYVRGDGQMFRHILNFLRCGQLMLPAKFREWPLLCHEIGEFDIPALSEALQKNSEYRAWCKHKDLAGESHSSLAESLLIHGEQEDDCGEPESHSSVEQTDYPECKQDSCWKLNNDLSLDPSVTIIPSDVTWGKTRAIAQASTLHSVKVENTDPVDAATVTKLVQMREVSREPTHPCCNTDTLPELERLRTLWSQRGVDQRGNTVSKDGEILGLGQSEQTCGDVKSSRRSPPGRGSVLLVRHPPVLAKGEAGGYFTESVIYTEKAPPADHCVENMQTTNEDQKYEMFVYFNQSYKEMMYARECHAFLTGILLDSKKMNDSMECSAKIHNLVYFLWTEQLDPEHFVVELMKMACFKHQKDNMGLLLQWLEYTLPFAKQYSECLRLLCKNHRCITTQFAEGTLESPHPSFWVQPGMEVS